MGVVIDLSGVCGFLCIDNYIDSSEFVNLTPPEVKEMVPPIGLAKKIIRLIPKVGGWVGGCRINCHFTFNFCFIVSRKHTSLYVPLNDFVCRPDENTKLTCAKRDCLSMRLYTWC